MKNIKNTIIICALLILLIVATCVIKTIRKEEPQEKIQQNILSCKGYYRFCDTKKNIDGTHEYYCDTIFGDMQMDFYYNEDGTQYYKGKSIAKLYEEYSTQDAYNRQIEYCKNLDKGVCYVDVEDGRVVTTLVTKASDYVNDEINFNVSYEHVKEKMEESKDENYKCEWK